MPALAQISRLLTDDDAPGLRAALSGWRSLNPTVPKPVPESLLFPIFGKEQPLLVSAVHRGSSACAALLLEMGEANAETINAALIAASSKGLKELCRLLVAHGAHPNTTGAAKTTPLIEAAASGCTDVCAWLLEQGAAVDQENVGGVTALIAAARQGHPQVCRLLVEGGANPNHATLGGATALHLAGASADISLETTQQVALVLLEAGADPNARTIFGKRSIDMGSDHLATFVADWFKARADRIVLEHGRTGSPSAAPPVRKM